jgi:hypothetical protein
LTGLPESLGQLATLTSLKLEACGMRGLPSVCFHAQTLSLVLFWSFGLPPLISAKLGTPAIKAFLLMHHYPLKVLVLIIFARCRRMRHLPPELWELICDEFSDANANDENPEKHKKIQRIRKN